MAASSEHPRSEGATCCPDGHDPRVPRAFDRAYDGWSSETGFPETVEVSSRLLAALRDGTPEHPSVLELGCGTGAVSVALLEMGARAVHGVDLSAASVDIARRRADAAGVGDRARFEAGQGAAVEGVHVDWVVLDRVLCCDRHPDGLLDVAIEAAARRVALTVPESRGWLGILNRLMWKAENVWDRFTEGCFGYVHDLRRIERRLAEAGFVPATTSRVGLWHLGIYDRSPPRPFPDRPPG